MNVPRSLTIQRVVEPKNVETAGDSFHAARVTAPVFTDTGDLLRSESLHPVIDVLSRERHDVLGEPADELRGPQYFLHLNELPLVIVRHDPPGAGSPIPGE
jgi:hypothetical protein